ncbi:rad2 superfamily protein mus201 isoform X1 [Nomia melanderi]|uniref:rad2 superfamily protein mus201 isoform X1 n=1 Tax=Nomia melanderi TaxID=2448451 RepID=UPI003FCCDE39
MGVHGLWRLLDATGKQVPLETLEGKILAIDISIWIHQVLQGYQDRFGNPKPNAHLIGLFNRICKLLYYKIKPVFVFDGGVPMLKKDTIALRRKQKSMAKNKAVQMRTELINNLIKQSAVKTVLNPEEQNVPNNSSQKILTLQNKETTDDMFKLPDMPSTNPAELSLSDDYDSDSSFINISPRKQTKWVGNIHNVDVASTEFKALPADVRYEILTDLKETRKQNSWGRLHEMPDESNQFSNFQMNRLLKRRLVQQSLESAEKEMGGKSLTLDELEKLLTEQGINTKGRDCTYRIAADSTTRLVYISDKNAYIKNISNNDDTNSENPTTNENKAEEPVAGTSKGVRICEDLNEYEFDDDWNSDVEIITPDTASLAAKESSSEAEFGTELSESRPVSKKYFGKHTVNPALTYMLEYSGLTEDQIFTLLEQNKREDRSKASKNTVETTQQSDVVIKTENSISEDNKGVKESAKVDTTEAVDSATSEIKLSESNKKTDITVPTITMSNTSNEAPVETDATTVISSTDSDSDFVEIEDAPIFNFDNNVKKNVSEQGIQISFKCDENIKDDMFADVFGATNNESKSVELETKPEDVSASNERVDKLENELPNRSEILEHEVILEKTVAETVEEKVKDPSDTTKTDDIEVLSVTNIADDKDTCTQLEETDTTEINSVEMTNDSYENSLENKNVEDSESTTPSIIDSLNMGPLPTNEDELMSLQARLEDEQSELLTDMGKFERQGTSISTQISVEAQELLRLFGIPYIVAPMEAEAQCAYLEQIHLTDGTITDDSDIWLFGGQCVYKNFFASDKKVLQYRFCDIHHHFKLTRNELIRLALLVGSDYTVGLTGIGPVTALEILAAFPSQGDDLLHGLSSFCSWIKSGRVTGPRRTSLRNKLQNLQIQKGFPNQAVVQAYLVPEVDESREGFTWGKPNTVLLSNYARQKFGWTKHKFDEIITPILKRLEEKQSQKLIDAYFKLQTVPKSIDVNLSKRVQKAVQGLNNPSMAEQIANTESVQPKLRRKRPASSTENRKKRKDSTDKREQQDEQTLAAVSADSEAFNVSVTKEKCLESYIPQREKDKAEALKKRLNAIEVLRKSKQGLYKTKKVKRYVRKVKEEARLSESDSGSS